MTDETYDDHDICEMRRSTASGYTTSTCIRVERRPAVGAGRRLKRQQHMKKNTWNELLHNRKNVSEL